VCLNAVSILLLTREAPKNQSYNSQRTQTHDVMRFGKLAYVPWAGEGGYQQYTRGIQVFLKLSYVSHIFLGLQNL